MDNAFLQSGTDERAEALGGGRERGWVGRAHRVDEAAPDRHRGGAGREEGRSVGGVDATRRHEAQRRKRAEQVGHVGGAEPGGREELDERGGRRRSPRSA